MVYICDEVSMRPQGSGFTVPYVLLISAWIGYKNEDEKNEDASPKKSA
jgi:hypothetical protein